MIDYETFCRLRLLHDEQGLKDQSIIGNVYAVMRERAECLEKRRQTTDETRILAPSPHGRSWVNEPTAPAHAGSRSLSPAGPALWKR